MGEPVGAKDGGKLSNDDSDKTWRVFLVETMMHITSKAKGEGSGTWADQYRMDPGL